mgnify:FL=1
MSGEYVIWLLAPLSGAAEHHIAGWVSWHGRLMVLGWGILIPVGALLARYLKVLPGQDWPRELDNKWWWHAHLLFQLSGVFFACLAAFLIWGHAVGATPLAQVHGYLGWCLSAFAAGQIVSGVLRGSKGGPTDGSIPAECLSSAGDHYLMTRRRLLFERLHKALGWLAIFVAAIVIVMGLVVADAPRWMFIGLSLWWIAYAALSFYWQWQGRCIDTYQAIWGDDETLPGLRIKPIGWGIKRFSGLAWRNRLYGRALLPGLGFRAATRNRRG